MRLCTYAILQPRELERIQEKIIDLVNGILIKDKRPKLVPMLDDDVELVRSLPRGEPEDYFFRLRKMLRRDKSAIEQANTSG